MRNRTIVEKKRNQSSFGVSWHKCFIIFDINKKIKKKLFELEGIQKADVENG